MVLQVLSVSIYYNFIVAWTLRQHREFIKLHLGQALYQGKSMLKVGQRANQKLFQITSWYYNHAITFIKNILLFVEKYVFINITKSKK